MLLETPAPTRAEIDALVAKEAERLRRAYRPLPPADERAPVPVPRRVRGRWTRVLKFPLTARRFERVFHAQGEPLVARWRLALRFALVTLRRTPSEIHPPRQTPSAGGSGQASAVPPAGSLT